MKDRSAEPESTPTAARHLHANLTRQAMIAFARERIEQLLEQWWRVAPAPDGLLQPTHGPRWERSDDRRRTLVTQARFVHNFATGWRLTGDERWREAARQAVRGLREKFPLTPTGLPVFCVNESGAVEDGRVWSYGVAFALFGLAHGAAVDADPAIPATAERWWQALQRLRDRHGGWAWTYTATGEPEPGLRTHNPIMHLLEALLAWQRHDRRWGERIAPVLRFLHEKLLAPGRRWLPEFCDEDWRPVTGGEMDFISIGHQWEWAHLLVQTQVAGWPGADPGLARTLAATGRDLGLRAPDHLVSQVAADGRVLADRHLYWDYCEAIRACVWLTAHKVEPDLHRLLPGLMAGLETRLFDPRNRGYATTCDQPVGRSPKGSCWRVDYHQIAAFADLIDHAGILPA